MLHVLALAYLMCLPAHAEPKVWMGSGQVVSGQGQGAAVQLVIETNGGRIRTHSGPHLDATLSGQSQILETDVGTWHIEPLGNRMSVTLYRGEQIIRYLLQPASAPAGGMPSTDAAPLNTDETIVPLTIDNGSAPSEATALPVLEVLNATDTVLSPMP